MNDSRPPLLPLILAEVPPGLRIALAQEGVPVRPWRPGAPDGRFVLFDGRKTRCPRLGAGQVAVDVDRLRDGPGPDPMEALSDQRSQRHQWHVAGLDLVEEIARVDRRAVRRRLLGTLRARIEQAGGIWLCVAPYPFPYRSAFNFRFDYDQYDPSDFDAMLRAISGWESATSHFVNGAAYQGAGEALARLRGLDVGSHGFRHHTYRTEDENLHNVRRGIETLAAAGLAPRGFVAPHGRFNRQLLSALESLGVPYSSEFGLAYDELPFYPEGSEVLQVPVHPVSLGLFLDAVLRQRQPAPGENAVSVEAAVDAASHYFARVARARYLAGEPVFFYGHPTGRLGRYPRLLRGVFETVSDLSGIWRTTLSEMRAWWRARAKVRLTVRHIGERYVVIVHHKPPGCRVAIEYWRGGHAALIPLDGSRVRLSPGALAFERRAAVSGGFRPVRVDRPEGLRSRVRRMLDWERETPVEEIGAGTWRNWAKRTLRQWWKP